MLKKSKVPKRIIVCATIVSIAILLSFRSETLPTAEGQSMALHTTGQKVYNAMNEEIYFRIIGRAGDLDSLTANWGGRGDYVFSYSYKWLSNTAELTRRMDETFEMMVSYWHVNTIRCQIPVDWWWLDNVNPYQSYGQGPNQVISYRDYWELLAQRAAAKGMYVIFVPASIFNYYTNFEVYGGDNGGQPGALSARGAQFMQKIASTETQAWSIWWKSVISRLGQYPNVIFEMWNEPDGTSTDKINWFNYVFDTYETIRGLGCDNVIMLQWRMGLVPGRQEELTWVADMHQQLSDHIGGTPTNVVYTAHPYRHAPSFNSEWKFTYADVYAQLTTPTMLPAARAVNAPFCFNEGGVVMDLTGQELEDELTYWASLLRLSREFNIGVSAYFWLQPDMWTRDFCVIARPGLWESSAQSPSPSRSGQTFIAAYRLRQANIPCPYNDGAVFNSQAELDAHVAAVHDAQTLPNNLDMVVLSPIIVLLVCVAVVVKIWRKRKSAHEEANTPL